MVSRFLRYTAFLLGIVVANASQDWILKFEALQDAIRTAPNGIIKEDSIQILDDLAKSAPSLKDRLLVLDLIPNWFLNAKSQFITSGLRSSLNFLVETSTAREEQKKQVEVLGGLASVLREFPPSPEDELNLREVRNMLGILAGSGKDLDICLLAVDCSMNRNFFHWAMPNRDRFVPLLRSFLDGDRAIRDNPRQRAKAALLLSQLAETGDCDFVIEVLSSHELSSIDLVLEITESHKNLAKVVGTSEQRFLLLSFFETQIDNPDGNVRCHVTEGLQALAEKSEELVERQKLRIALGALAKDENKEVIEKVGDGFKHLATKAKEFAERSAIQEFVQIILHDYVKWETACYGACSTYKFLVENSESTDELRILRAIVPDFLTYVSKDRYWFAASVCKAFFENATEPEERLFLGKKLSDFYTPEQGRYSDVGYDLLSIFTAWADQATTYEERQMVLDVITKPYCYPLEKINTAIAAIYETDCKARVREFVEGTLKKLDESSRKGVEILKLLSQTPRSGEDLAWIKAAYISVLEEDGSGIFWYAQEDAVVGCRKLCEKIADADERRKVMAELDLVIQEREERERAICAEFPYD